MKILQITPAFIPSQFGGIAIQSYYLSRELAKRGHEVTVYTSNAADSRTKLDRKGAYDIEGMKVVYFNNYMPHRRLFLFLTPSMVKSLREEMPKYEVVHLHGIRNFQNVAANYYCGKYDVPYVVSPHGSLPQILNWVLLKKVYDRTLGHKVLAEASRVIALTPAEADQCRERGVKESKIVQSTNGIDLKEYEQLPERGAFRKKYDIKERSVILFLGRIHKIKGLDILAEAFAEILRDGEDIRLVIVGADYGYYTQLKKILSMLNVENKVTFTGFLSGEAKIQAYVDSDIYALPSIYESFSTTVLEALACGTPVVITDRCGIADAIRGQAGLVVPYDKDQLRDALLHMLSDERMRLDFGRRGRLLVQERYNWARIAGQIEGIYRSLLSDQ